MFFLSCEEIKTTTSLFAAIEYKACCVLKVVCDQANQLGNGHLGKMT